MAIHHRAYSFNGRGCIFAGALGMLFSCVSKALFIILQFVIARGWALFFAAEERGQLLVIVAALLGLAGLSMGCEVYGWRVQDSTTDLYLYESWPGVINLYVNLGLLALAWLFTLKNASQEVSHDVRMFYFRVSASAGVYFASLPVVCLLASFLVPWVRQKYTERVELCARLISTALLLLQLWPTHLDMMVGARMKGRVSSLTNEDEDFPVITSDHQNQFLDSLSGDDEERVLTSEGMGFEDGLLVQ